MSAILEVRHKELYARAEGGDLTKFEELVSAKDIDINWRNKVSYSILLI